MPGIYPAYADIDLGYAEQMPGTYLAHAGHVPGKLSGEAVHQNLPLLAPPTSGYRGSRYILYR